MLLKFKKSLLPLVWNALFTFLFCFFSKRITGSDNANKLFPTLLYALYSGENIDLGQILWVQFSQSISSSTKNSEISCAIFWSIVVRNACDHFKVPIMADAQMATFPVLNTTTFVLLTTKDFHYIGAIPEVLLKEVPSENEVISIYRKIRQQGPRPFSPTMQDDLESTIAPRRTSGKRKGKVVKEVVSHNPYKKQKKKKKKQISVVDEDVKLTTGNNRNNDIVMFDDTTKSSDANDQMNTTVPIATTIHV
ncbi:unnamed protein product [Lactuca virosa]|uniref:Uncharacterized protein n=1 Tax=Lactuca virosa TaxID=75947 RepID=A0AAU9M610_9ASTR|nr:unnamed protein product [Lactuca virosa]